MQTEYIYSYNRNYVKWKVSVETGQKLRYQYQIITSEKMEGLLTADMYTTDGINYLYYEISDMQSLDKWLVKEKINRKWMSRFVEGLKTAIRSLDQYLLEERNLLTEPEHIFIHMETEKVYFVYFPYYIEETPQDMEKLLAFFIENADENEPETVEWLYDVYEKRQERKEQFTWESFRGMWEKFTEKQEVATDLPSGKEDNSIILFPETTEIAEENLHVKKDNGKKDFADFLFGRNKLVSKRPYKGCVAMEDLHYKTEPDNLNDAKDILQEDMQEETIQEERKLFGNGKQNRRVLHLETLPAVVGRKENVADIVLADTSIGIMHARFTEENGQVYLEDLNTEHGTYKNSVRLKPYEKVEILREDEIRLGKLLFTYR